MNDVVSLEESPRKYSKSGVKFTVEKSLWKGLGWRTIFRENKRVVVNSDALVNLINDKQINNGERSSVSVRHTPL